MKKFIIPLVIVVAGLLLMKGLASLKKPQKKHVRPPQIKSVAAAVVAYSAANPPLQALGRVRSEQPVNLAAEVPGAVLPGQFAMREGSHFNKGQVLVQIDSRRAELSFKSAVSALLNAFTGYLPEVKVDMPEVYSKWNAFFGDIAFSTLPALPEAESQKEKLYLSRFNIYNLYFTAKSLQITLEKHTLYAPFTGSVVTSNVRPGSMVGMGAPMGVIIRTDKLEVETPMAIGEVNWIETKSAADILIKETGRRLKGRVDRISRSLGSGSQTVSVFLTIAPSKGAGILDGMFAEVTFQGRKIDSGFVLPRRAVVNKREVYSVKEGRLKTVAVDIARLGIENAYITGGLSPGDTVVSQSLQDAIEGMLVKPVLQRM